MVVVQQCYHDLVFTYRSCLSYLADSFINHRLCFFKKKINKKRERKSYGPVYGLLDSFFNFEYLLNLDREICLAKEINILILIMLIKSVMAVIKGIGRGKIVFCS